MTKKEYSRTRLVGDHPKCEDLVVAYEGWSLILQESKHRWSFPRRGGLYSL